MPAPLRILLVEDHEPTNRALASLLARRGHQVSAALTVAASLELAARLTFDLVISDIGLPDGKGWDLLGLLRKLHPGMRAIAFSGYGYDGDLQKSKEAGFDLHLTKPVEMPALERSIAKLFSEPGVAPAAPVAENSGRRGSAGA